MSKELLDVVGIGNAIVDVLSKTEEDFLKINRINKGTMTLIEADQAETLYSKMGPGIEMSGGSVANTIAAIASLGGKGGYIGKVANDQLGQVFGHDIRAMGVHFNTPALTDGPPTARCLILVTPDAQRTMCTFLGACVWIAPTDIDEELVKNAKVTYLEGYLFDRTRAKMAFKRAGDIAHAAGRKTALSLSDPFCVARHRDEFLDLVKQHTDIVFANEAEITALYKTEDFNEAVYHVRQDCELAVLTRADKGSLIVAGNEMIEVAAEPVGRVVDTTGAGDLYAAGFLFGYTRGLPLPLCGRIASISASEVLGHLGARPQTKLDQLLKEKNIAV